jgi:hypothetical protein
VNIRVVLKHGFATLVAAAFVLPLAAAGAAPGALEGLQRVSEDNIVDGAALHQSEVQPSLATDGTHKTLVGAFEVGRIFNGGSSAIGWTTSSDGGTGWHDGLLPLTVASKQATTGAGTLWRAADPSAAYDDNSGTWLIASTGLDGTGGARGLFINRSRDGHKWSDPVIAHAAGAGDAPQNASLACDNWPSSQGYGTCYLAYNNTSSTPANLLQVVTSTDGGATWSAPASTPDASTGTGAVALVQPPPPGAAPGTACGRVVVAYAGGGGISWISSGDCGASWSAHTQLLPNMSATHAPAQNLRTGLVVSASTDGAGAIYLAWQSRNFRLAQTTLAADASAGDTNIKVASVSGLLAGDTITVDSTGAGPQTVTIAAVGTAGSAGTGVTFTPALSAGHATGSFVALNGRAQTTLSAAAAAGATNIKVASVSAALAGNTIVIDATGANPETVTIRNVGTAGATGTGIDFSPALGFAHANGALVLHNSVRSGSASTATPNDIALSVMPATTDATPTPGFGPSARIPIEADDGAASNTVDQFVPAIAADPNSSGASARIALFYYFYPLAACQYVNNPSNACSPRAGYVSSTDGAATWSAPQSLSPGPPSLAVLPRTLALGATGNGGPDLGSVLGAAVVPVGKLQGKAIGLFPVGIPVNGTDVSMYVPKHGLTIGGGS